MRSFTFLISLFLSLAMHAQEICDNAIDDDGDGLIDLLDSDCACSGVVSQLPSVNLIPNGSFADFDCCPTLFSQLYCAQSWSSANTATPDFSHTCGYLSEAGLSAGILPPPDGNGVAGFIASPEWKEYLRVCLETPIVTGTECVMSLELASMPIDELGVACAGSSIFYGDLELSVYGNTQCTEFPQIGFSCLLPSSTGWQLLGSATYSPELTWSELELTFTAPDNLLALAIGPPCDLTSSYELIEPFCYPYFFVDNVEVLIFDEVETGITVEATGNLCDNNATLNASAIETGGSWQWYLNGIALLGQNQPTLELSDNNLPAGLYTAVYTLGASCADASIEINDQSNYTGSQTVTICANETYTLPNGETVSAAGAYEVAVENGAECDSLITFLINVLPSFFTEESFFLCEGDTLTLPDGTSITTFGNFTQVLTTVTGCDSIFNLQVTALPGPDAAFTFFTTDLAPSEPLNLQNISVGAITFLWEWGGLSSDELAPNWNIGSGPIEAPICLTAFAANGCFDQVCLNVFTEEDFTFYCPNAFTPDDDGRNEGFGAVVRGHDPGQYVFEVWNRWGERIFFSNSDTERWIGNHQGGAYYVPNGAYYWRAQVKPLQSPEILEFSGHVILIR